MVLTAEFVKIGGLFLSSLLLYFLNAVFQHLLEIGTALSNQRELTGQKAVFSF
jgi:hypothetical protein